MNAISNIHTSGPTNTPAQNAFKIISCVCSMFLFISIYIKINNFIEDDSELNKLINRHLRGLFV